MNRDHGHGCHIRSAAKRDIEALENTGLPSTKVFMLPDKLKIRATQNMLLKHNYGKGQEK
jgi:hypothetical protein